MPIRSYVLPHDLVQRILAHKRVKGLKWEEDAAIDLIEAGLALQPDQPTAKAQGCRNEREVEKAESSESGA
ncbi:hypothetical protein GCM10019059_37900 [Camelimonas fluminis]|nr:hypothetical protein GCM10019059_37900 [Camelimonas fluminis]